MTDPQQAPRIPSVPLALGTQPDGPPDRCAYGRSLGGGCDSKATAGYTYCTAHLKLVTRPNIKKIVYAIVVEQLGVAPDKVSDSATFIDDLGADSLDTVELILVLQEAFDIFISDEEAERIETVAHAWGHIADRLEVLGRYVETAECDVRNIPSHLGQDPVACRRQVTAVLRGPVFRDYLQILKLPYSSLFTVMCDALGGLWAEHVTTVPARGTDGTVAHVEVILLTRSRLVNISLQRNMIEWHVAPIADVLLWSRLSLNAQGIPEVLRIWYALRYTDMREMIRDKSKARKGGALPPLPLTFKTDDGIAAGLDFLRKFHMFSHGGGA